jgi:hypothetical protein
MTQPIISIYVIHDILKIKIQFACCFNKFHPSSVTFTNSSQTQKQFCLLVDYVKLHICVEYHATQQKFMVTKYCTIAINIIVVDDQNNHDVPMIFYKVLSRFFTKYQP